MEEASLAESRAPRLRFGVVCAEPARPLGAAGIPSPLLRFLSFSSILALRPLTSASCAAIYTSSSCDNPLKAKSSASLENLPTLAS